MKVALSTIGKYHTFDLARQLLKRQMLAMVFTGYPKFKLRNEGLPSNLVRSFSWLQTMYMARGRYEMGGRALEWEMAWWAKQTLDTYVASRLPECDVFMGLSGSSLKTGRIAQKRGAAFVCDRGSSHIRYQDRVLREEYARHGLNYSGIDPRKIAKEEEEYAVADAITVPSSFGLETFLEMGVPREKMRLVPYGVDLTKFYPTGAPDPEKFDVLFVGAASLRKGIPYLLESFDALRHPGKRLTLVGATRPEVEAMIAQAARRMPIVRAGHCAQTELKDIMSRSHVLVLPSIEEGLALVQAQAMACACPVLATHNTGAPDLYDDGVEGFIVPMRDPQALTARMQFLADEPLRQQQMSAAALERVAQLVGWDRYGDIMVSMLSELCGYGALRKRISA